MVQNAPKDFPSVTALPMLSYAISGALDAAKDQLGSLQKTKNRGVGYTAICL